MIIERHQFLYRSTRISAILWISCIIAVIILLGVSTKWFTGTVQDTQLGNSELFIILFLSLIGLGIFSFGILVLSIIVNVFLGRNEIKKQFINTWGKRIKANAFSIIVIILLIASIGYLYAKTQEHETKKSSISSTENEKFPVDKLELQNVKYNGKILSGLILNKGNKTAFDTQISLKISKDRSIWSVEEQHDFNVPYKIDPNQAINFSESFKTTKTNPWSSTAIVEAKYYNGENVPVLLSTPSPKPKVYVNPDPIIPCTMSKECGGDVRNIKKSECTNGTCCQIVSTWIFYPSRDKCIQDQKASQSTQQTQQSTQSTTKLNYYCYDNTLKYSYYTSSGEQCNKDNASSACKALTKSSMYDPCMQKCLDTVNENDQICIWGYFGANATIENNPTKYQECIDEASAEHQKCMDACANPYQEALKKCY